MVASDFRRVLLHATREAGLSLADRQVQKLCKHHELLLEWGRRMNLTALRQTEEVVRRHFLEGLLAGEFLPTLELGGPLLDLGSGNGFPAVPLHVACPDARPITLVESSHKRGAFLKALLREIDLGVDARVEVRRVERSADLEDLSCLIFTTRGVKPYRFLQEGLPFLRPGGVALLFMSKKTLQREIPRLPESLVLEAEARLPERDSGLLLVRQRTS